MRRNVLIFNFALAMIEGMFCVSQTLAFSSDATNSLILGYSPFRLLLVAGITLLTLFWGALIFQIWMQPAWSKSLLARLGDASTHVRVFRLLILFFIFCFLLSLLPNYWFYENADFFDRLRPFWIWFTLIFGQSALSLIVINWPLFHVSMSTMIAGMKPVARATASILVVFLAIWIFIAITRLGLTPDVAYWNEAGVPILGIQILAALALSLGVAFALFQLNRASHPLVVNSIGKIQIVDIILCFMIWVLAVGIWLSQPMPHSYFAPRPVPPNNVFYPFSDAAYYDVGGQYVLIGQGVFDNSFSDKPFYMFFLGLLHAIGGQSYTMVMGLQVLVLALFPVILYLFGAQLQGRGAGIFIALLAIFKERNAIAASQDIQLTHSRLMMTEMPTALAVLLFAFLLFRWLKNPMRSNALPLWAGGVLGVAMLVRSNPFMILPFALLVVFMVYGRGWRRAIVPVVLLLAGISLVVLPVLLTNRDAQGRIYIQLKIDAVLNRYQWQFPGGVQSTPTPQSSGGAPQLAALFQPSNAFPISLIQATSPLQTMQGSGQAGGGEPSMMEFIPAHFFHNLVATALILPLTWTYQDLPHTIASPLWNLKWTGALTSENVFFLFLNLFLISLGMALAWRRWRVAGLIPVFILIGYFLANALARTSGSRYLIPVDWALYFYYALGLFQLAAWILLLMGVSLQTHDQADSVEPKAAARRYWVAPVIILLALGSAIPLSDVVVPQRYPALTKRQAFTALQQVVSLKELGLDKQKYNAFLSNPRSVVFRARALYPRYYKKDKGACTICHMLDAVYKIQTFSRLSFIAIGPFRAGVVMAMLNSPADFPDGADVWVIGCNTGVRTRSGPTVQGIVVIVVDGDGVKVYNQSPSPKLVCKKTP